MPETSWVSLLVQVPLVGIFVWFVLTMMDRQAKEQQSRDEQWRNFLREQREANNSALARLAEEIKSIAQEVAQMRQVISNHELQTACRMGRLEKSSGDHIE